MKTRLLISIVAAGLSLTACAAFLPERQGAADMAPGADVVRPKPRPVSLAPPPPANASTVEDFDTTSATERQAAAGAVPDTGGERALGLTIAALGNPAQPGFWLETPLVSAPAKGRVVAVATGESVLVDLLPIDAPQGAGSRISLAALRLLGVALTGLHQLQVYEL